MKQMILFVMMAMLVVSVVSASDSTLSDNSISMAYNDTAYVDYCIDNVNGQQNINVTIDSVCRDADGIYGCSVADDSATGLFDVQVIGPQVINEGECTTLMLTTTINNEADGGNFYYTVNGRVGGVALGSGETGLVQVPEFGVLAALGVLGLAGLFIYRKRK